MDERARRVGQNEAVARKVNQKLEDLNEAFSTFSGTFAIMCECGDAACSEQIQMSRDDYEQVRSEPTQFVVVRGHEVQTTEAVVDDRGSYCVVRKHEGAPAQLVRATDS